VTCRGGGITWNQQCRARLRGGVRQLLNHALQSTPITHCSSGCTTVSQNIALIVIRTDEEEEVVGVVCGEWAGEATCVRMRILGLICCLRFFNKGSCMMDSFRFFRCDEKY
jgi:hypothetical protein